MGVTDPDADPPPSPVDGPGAARHARRHGGARAVRVRLSRRRGGLRDLFEDVHVPAADPAGEEGGGFAIAQARLGPGRIHHCMRAIGMAERAFDLMCRRAVSRTAFGKELARQGVIQQWIAESRIEIEQARLLVLKTAWLIDTAGKEAARVEVSAIKVAVPRMASKVIDRAIQVYGGGGRLPGHAARRAVRRGPHAPHRRWSGRGPRDGDRASRAETIPGGMSAEPCRTQQSTAARSASHSSWRLGPDSPPIRRVSIAFGNVQDVVHRSRAVHRQPLTFAQRYLCRDAPHGPCHRCDEHGFGAPGWPHRVSARGTADLWRREPPPTRSLRRAGSLTMAPRGSIWSRPQRRSAPLVGLRHPSIPVRDERTEALSTLGLHQRPDRGAHGVGLRPEHARVDELLERSGQVVRDAIAICSDIRTAYRYA